MEAKLSILLGLALCETERCEWDAWCRSRYWLGLAASGPSFCCIIFLHFCGDARLWILLTFTKVPSRLSTYIIWMNEGKTSQVESQTTQVQRDVWKKLFLDMGWTASIRLLIFDICFTAGSFSFRDLNESPDWDPDSFKNLILDGWIIGYSCGIKNLSRARKYELFRRSRSDDKRLWIRLHITFKILVIRNRIICIGVPHLRGFRKSSISTKLCSQNNHW